MAAFDLDTWAGLFYCIYTNGQVHHNVYSTSDGVCVCVCVECFLKVLVFHFPKVTLNVTCQPLYASAMQSVECY
jgi:hypothetical protein